MNTLASHGGYLTVEAFRSLFQGSAEDNYLTVAEMQASATRWRWRWRSCYAADVAAGCCCCCGGGYYYCLLLCS